MTSSNSNNDSFSTDEQGVEIRSHHVEEGDVLAMTQTDAHSNGNVANTNNTKGGLGNTAVKVLCGTAVVATVGSASYGAGVNSTVAKMNTVVTSQKASAGKSDKSKAGKKVCLEYGFLDKVVLPAGPIPAADATCDPTPTNAAYDPQQCPVYFEPFFLADASSSSSQYEQVDGKDGICTVDPLTSTAGDKFIMTYVGRLASNPADTSGLLYPDTPLSDFDELSYDFYVKECQNTETSCPEQFYTALYARSSATSPTPFYDCRFNYVPAAGGGEGTWTTFTFTADTPGRACGQSLSDCSVPCVAGWTEGGQYSLNDYIAATSDNAVISSAYAQAWSLNMGDSAASDEGLQGCYGDIRFTFADKTDVLQFTSA